MKRLGGYIICLIVLTALTACGGGGPKGPQRPANRDDRSRRDSDLVTMIQVNQRMAEEADREVMRYVQADTLLRYAQCSQGAWVARTTNLPDNEQPKMGEPVQIHMLVYTLDGRDLLQDVEGEFTLGRGELPLGIEYALRELRRGESGRILAPWHAAFGVDGADNIAPYSNVRIEITIH